MVKQWDSLSFLDQTRLKLEVMRDPVMFSGPYFLNIRDREDENKTGLWPMQQKTFRDFMAGGVNGYYNRFLLTGGMRMSKSFTCSYLALLHTFHYMEVDYCKKHGILNNSPVFGLVAAGKEEQADENIMTKMKPLIEDSPYFKAIGYDIHPLNIKLPKNFTIKVVTSKTSTEVGKTSFWVLIDEAANLEESAGPRGGDDFYRLISKSTATFKEDGWVLVDGTSRFPGDLAERLYERYLKMKHAMPLKYKTWEFNPNFTEKDFEEEMKDDPMGAARDFGGEASAGELVFFRNKDIFLLDQRNALQEWYDGLKPEPRGARYVLVGDPSTKKDAFGLGLAYRNGQEYIIDGVFRFKPEKQIEIDPNAVHHLLFGDPNFRGTDRGFGIVDYFPIKAFVTDIWSYQETLAEFKRRAIPVVQHFVKRDEYVVLKQLMYDKKVHLPDYGPLTIELTQLLDKGNKVDHPRQGSKDVADTVANGVWYLRTQMKPLSVIAMTMV